ncbi:helix-turn-helix domain-containing protein [Clostridium estertheticum]|uniref:BglG family transcription antiterminator n=1 Tax=Clostridium estertheticum TaxID=238834 RepID=UPI001C0D2E24|nr:PRD domain-containing protein [Clostridium estertheticum]MBU3215003.1 PRD domain-containing protein [Clostridium estertheticum]WAG57258.1 helix-turn-helix domain-containing protein [Clostridium estertheticum]
MIDKKNEVLECNRVINNFDQDNSYRHLSNPTTPTDFNDFHCRISYLLDQLINTENYLNIMDLSEKMNVSRGTVNNDLRKTKELLRKYDAEILGVTNKGIKLKCNEFSKRLILIYEVFDYFKCDVDIDNKTIDLLELLAQHYKFNDQMELLFYKSTLVTIDRIKKGRNLKTSIPMYKNFEINSKTLNDFIMEIENIYKIKFNYEDIDFISFPINTRNSAHTGNIENTVNQEILLQIVKQMLVSIRERFMIEINEKTFYNKVRHHLLFLINRLIFRIPVNDIFSDQIKIRFPLAFELAKISMSVLQKQYHLMGTEIDISYLAVYFALILDDRKVYYKSKNSDGNIAVVTNNGRGTFELIRKQLQEIVGLNSNIDLLTVSELKIKDVSNYGMIFSTENIISDRHLPIIKIDGIIDQDSITQKLKELKKKNLEPIANIMKLENLKILYLDGSVSYRDNVKIITSKLIDEEYVSSDIYSIFEKKDNLSSMIYENGVAFPHLIDKKINNFSLTIGIIKPNTDKLKIILFLLIPENMDNQQEGALLKIYDEIFTIISDKELVIKLQDIEDIY